MKFTLFEELQDGRIGFDEFFDGFLAFSGKTARPDFWKDELEKARSAFGKEPLIAPDNVLVVVEKGAGMRVQAESGSLVRKAHQ